MKNKQSDRRHFIKNTAAAATGLTLLSAFSKKSIIETSSQPREEIFREPRLKFSVIAANHNHIYAMCDAVIRGGGELVSYYIKEADLSSQFGKRYAQAKQVNDEREILEDKSIQLVLSSAIPIERAPIGIRAMKHGKDYLVDKPGITSLEQLAEVKKVQKETKRIFSIMYSERLESRATVKAGELVKAGAIGQVIQTNSAGPHRMNTNTRPEWFFDKKYFGGIITDIGSHQFDQFLYFTNSTKANVIASQVGNVHHPQYPKFEDFGDVLLKGNGGAGYIQVNWFTPDGLSTWGDGRLTILGTEGYIELRKYVDIAGRPGGNHLFLVNQKETKYIDCSKEPLPFGELFVNDILNRTETAMPQAHCFLATELALKAQKSAQVLNIKAVS